ncbi:HD domain-containing phosphohydrolase [Agaribacterium haliotis]|uniref:HD domain-containing phosphohydrolase n=1 Tax=Agaribacterium haliotis TaxID=2013869 RepID=UPI001177D421|nr:HD domain-containing phosphohydrolase [Agaribacterium haliotis]
MTLQQQELNADRQATVLFIDDEEAILRAMLRLTRGHNWKTMTATSAQQAFAIAEREDIDVVISDMRMPDINGAELLAHFYKNSPTTRRILLTGYSDIGEFSEAVNKAHIYNYLSKPWQDKELTEIISAALQSRQDELKQQQQASCEKAKNIKLSKIALLLDKQVKERSIEVDQALQLLDNNHKHNQGNILDSVLVINRIIEWKEGGAHGQSDFVSYYAIEMAQQLNFSDSDIEAIRLASLLHRVGLLALPDDIRHKPIYALSAEQLKLYKQYPIWGEKCIRHSKTLVGVANIVRHHREAINGNGFPDGLSQKQIPIAAQIVGLVSDFYDAYSGQISREIRGVESAKVYINEWAGRRHDVKLVQLFWQVLADYCDTSLQSCVLPSCELKSGMLLNKDVVSSSGCFLLAKGTVLSPKTIKKLIEYETTHRELFEVHIRIVPENEQSSTQELV